MIEPLLSLSTIHPHGTRIFMQLASRAYSETQGHIRRFIMNNYASTLEQFYQLIYSALPCLNSHDVFLRLHFSMGAVLFTFAGKEAFSEISQADFNQTIDVRQITQKLIPYLAAGLEAPCLSAEKGLQGEL